jgi:hypothetical protein
MVLISSMMFAKNFMKKDIENFTDQFRVNSGDSISDYKRKSKMTTLTFVSMLFLLTISIIPALILSYNCTLSNTMLVKALHMTLAFLFSDVYIFIFVIYKFLLKDKKFCPNIIIKN